MRRVLLVLAILVAASSQRLEADGKMYAEKVPAKIPYQRALILHDGANETIVVQSRYHIAETDGASRLGWIVPVPTVPEVGSVEGFAADMIFQKLDMATAPEFVDVTSGVVLGIWGILCAFALFHLILAIFSKQRSSAKHHLSRMGIALLIAALVFLIAPFFIRQKKSTGGVEVVKSQRAGIYDIQVIRSDNADALIEWLDSNGLRHGPEDQEAFDSHIRRGWCFVTAKLAAGEKATSRGSALADPLILRFPASQPVYPTALTASAGADTMILIYVVADAPMGSASTLKRLAITDSSPEIRRELLYSEPESLSEQVVLTGRFLTKFKGILKPSEMKEDITFSPDPGLRPFRERRFR